ncbi:MAG: response regulator [Dehalococcoidales bacterium]
MEQARILVVEDETIVAMDIAGTLRKLGHAVTDTVPFGEQAIESVNGNKPDLIFMDIGLKGPMDGIETAAKIRARFSIPVIFLTAFVDEKTLDRAKETLPAGYLTKPFEENDLRIAIEVGLYRARLEKEREKLLRELQEALSKIKTLSGLIPICAWCKKIRDDQGYWHTVEQYVEEHSQAEFTHGMCPDCQKKYMADDK